MATKRDDVRTLLDRNGTTYAEEAGIRLADKPSPLYRLLVVALLLSARIAPPSVTMRQTSSAVTGLIASTTCPAKPAIDVAVSTAADAAPPKRPARIQSNRPRSAARPRQRGCEYPCSGLPVATRPHDQSPQARRRPPNGARRGAGAHRRAMMGPWQSATSSAPTYSRAAPTR
jgi:hypothetical protein